MLFIIFLAATVLPGILGCCQPKQISGHIFMPQGMTDYFAVDYNISRVLRRHRTGSFFDYIVKDWMKGVQYTVYRNGICHKRNIPIDPSKNDRCIPTSAHVRQFNLGPAGSEAVQNSFYKIGTTKYYFTTTTDKCLPVMKIQYYNYGNHDLRVYSNIKDTITEANKFYRDFSNCTTRLG